MFVNGAFYSPVIVLSIFRVSLSPTLKPLSSYSCKVILIMVAKFPIICLVMTFPILFIMSFIDVKAAMFGFVDCCWGPLTSDGSLRVTRMKGEPSGADLISVITYSFVKAIFR